jgi:uncharacterized membrane protein (DUF485 family)
MPDTPTSATPPSEPGTGHVHRRSEHPVYQELHASEEFARLRSNYRRFALPWTIGFLSWYLLYVVMSNWAGDFMSTKVVGHINIALVFGVLQFVSTFLIAWLYGRYMNDKVDPIARELNARYDAQIASEVPR